MMFAKGGGGMQTPVRVSKAGKLLKQLKFLSSSEQTVKGEKNELYLDIYVGKLHFHRVARFHICQQQLCYSGFLEATGT